MYDGKKILGIIPARGGSKGVPRKNIRNLAGKPLIAWTIETAKESRYIDTCIVSTEDEEIKTVSEAWGGYCPFLRPEDLAQDDTPSVDVVLHVIDEMPDYDYIVLLQTTSPLRSTEDIDECIKFCFQHESKSCVSVTEAERSPFYMYKIDEDAVMHSILDVDYDSMYQRQKLPKVYQLNGAVYVVDVNFVRKYKRLLGCGMTGYIMPQERSHDIDSVMDFMIVERIIRERKMVE